jgi:hypothetical protein
LVESDLRGLVAGTDQNRFRKTLDNFSDEFKRFRIKLKLDDSSDGKWYWGRAEDIEEAIRLRDLS